jgi:hypothetical protein
MGNRPLQKLRGPGHPGQLCLPAHGIERSIKTFLGRKSVRVWTLIAPNSHQVVRDPNTGCDICHTP